MSEILAFGVKALFDYANKVIKCPQPPDSGIAATSLARAEQSAGNDLCSVRLIQLSVVLTDWRLKLLAIDGASNLSMSRVGARCEQDFLALARLRRSGSCNTFDCYYVPLAQIRTCRIRTRVHHEQRPSV
jgi:hypothetical protein